MSIESMQLVWPAANHLAGYIDALKRGWSPDNRRPEAGKEYLARINDDPERFIAEQVDREAKGPAVILPDGSTVRRLPGYAQWIWDGEFCGSISFRWQRETTELPPHCLGHIGYSVVPWKRGRGYATHALHLFLTQVRQEGLDYVELVTDLDNIASRKVIEANGGELINHLDKPADCCETESLRYRIVLNQ